MNENNEFQAEKRKINSDNDANFGQLKSVNLIT